METEKIYSNQLKYYNANKEKISEKRKAIYQANKLKITEKQKEYYKNNKDKFKEYRENNKEKISENRKNTYENNKDEIKKYNVENKERIKNYYVEYRKLNLEKIKLQKKEYQNLKLKTDPIFKFKHNIRNNVRDAFKQTGFKKLSKTEQILGCTLDEFKQHIESLFEPWMTWDNYGNPKDGIYELNKTWDVDHIIPLSNANNEADIIKLNHYSNLQPLCSYTNRFIKKDNV